MIATNKHYLLMLEPTLTETPINDDLTELAGKVFSQAKPTFSWAENHVCSCGATSDHRTWVLPDGRVTNSLMAHYIKNHRSQVPESEIIKLKGYG